VFRGGLFDGIAHIFLHLPSMMALISQACRSSRVTAQLFRRTWIRDIFCHDGRSCIDGAYHRRLLCSGCQKSADRFHKWSQIDWGA
jgi:hypothetical protein